MKGALDCRSHWQLHRHNTEPFDPLNQLSTFPLQNRGFPDTQSAPGLEGGVNSQFLLALARPCDSSPICSGSIMVGWELGALGINEGEIGPR